MALTVIAIIIRPIITQRNLIDFFFICALDLKKKICKKWHELERSQELRDAE